MSSQFHQIFVLEMEVAAQNVKVEKRNIRTIIVSGDFPSTIKQVAGVTGASVSFFNCFLLISFMVLKANHNSRVP